MPLLALPTLAELMPWTIAGLTGMVAGGAINNATTPTTQVNDTTPNFYHIALYAAMGLGLVYIAKKALKA